MTNLLYDMEILERKNTGISIDTKRAVAVILSLIACLTLLDIIVDLIQGIDINHIIIEALVIPAAALGLYFVWEGLARVHSENISLQGDIKLKTSEAEAWRREAEKYLSGLSEAIDQQLERWKLSVSEKEIALLLLKGLSHKEIAVVRNTSERTARQQALAVYEKSALEGRAHLAAFFLEDLLCPQKLI